MAVHDRHSMTESDLRNISFGGERVSHLFPNDCFYAHLSIYHFALQFGKEGVVLDAGSGPGYGAAYLADHGARTVDGVDVSPQAVAFSKHYFTRPNLRFHVMDLQDISRFPSHHFDLVTSSNALEHVPDVRAFLRSAWSLLKPDGTLVVAVPPVTSEESRAANLANPYHLNIWTPRQWHHVFSLFFGHVECYRHDLGIPGVTLDFGNSPEQTRVSERDFAFEHISLEEFFSTHSLTVIFVVREPRAAAQVPGPGWELTFVDDSFTRPFAPPEDGPTPAGSLGEAAHEGFGRLLSRPPLILPRAAVRAWRRVMRKR